MIVICKSIPTSSYLPLSSGQILEGVRAALNTLSNELLDKLMLYSPTVPIHDVMMAHWRRSPDPVLHAKYRERFDVLRCLRHSSVFCTRFEACTIRDNSERTGPFLAYTRKETKGLDKMYTYPLVRYVLHSADI